MKYFGTILTIILVLTSGLSETLFGAGPQKLLPHQKDNYSAIFKIKAGGGLHFHLRDKDQENPNIPDQYEVLGERPSIAYFFNDHAGYNVNLGCSFFLGEEISSRLLIGFTYEHSSSSNKYSGSEIILGQNLVINTYNPQIGLEIPLGEISIFYLYTGLCFKYYSGSYEHEKTSWNYGFKPSVSLRLSGGIELSQIILPSMILDFGIILDLGNVIRGNVEAFQSGQRVIVAAPVGDKNLVDNTIQLKISLGYNFYEF